ncbi:4Fe-4S binding protein [Methanothermococcus sp. SCGC AD-155-C09]|nr:4Fe-4S binding protein [Methanothermococcus sp. SCGC AD-155-C09]
MSKIHDFFEKNLQSIRKIVQLLFFIYFVFLSGLCFCILGIIERFILIKGFYLTSTLMVLLLAIILGRVFCGWMCPFGFILDITYKLRMKVSKLKFPPTVSEKIHSKLIYLKYIILILFLYVTYSLSTYAFCKVCPIGTLTNFHGTVISIILLIFFIVMGFLYPMFFCRYFCPIGALLGIFSISPLFKVKLNNEKCLNCKLCNKKCPVQIELTKNIPQHECIRCFECKSACNKEAVKFGIK